MNWRSFLEQWSEERIDHHDPRQHGELDPEVVQARWLGRSPATAPELEEAEARIGRTLPPEYRELLQTTNGWPGEHPVYEFRSAKEIGWLKDLQPFWAEGLQAYDYDDDEVDQEINAISAIMDRSLLISGEADLTIVFLDPGDVDAHGNWATYRYSSWSGEYPERHDSLMDHLAAEHERWRQSPQERRVSLDAADADAAADRGKAAALAGDVETALTELTAAGTSAHHGSGLMLGQLRLLLGEREAALRLIGNPFFLANWRPEYATDPLVAGELLPVLLAEETDTASRGRMSTLRAALRASNPELEELAAQGRSRLETGRPVFGNREFDAKINDALDAHGESGEELWRAVLAALPSWRPLAPAHVAPVVLLAHPVLADLITPERGRELLATARAV